MAELLRAASGHDERRRFHAEDADVAFQLARRGVLDLYMHFSRVDGSWRLNSVGRERVEDLARGLAELGLLGERRVGRRPGSYWVTADGRATLADWDDPTADGA